MADENVQNPQTENDEMTAEQLDVYVLRSSQRSRRQARIPTPSQSSR